MSAEYRWIDEVLIKLRQQESEAELKAKKMAEYGNWLGLALSRLEKMVNALDPYVTMKWTEVDMAKFKQDLEACKGMVRWAKEQGLLE